MQIGVDIGGTFTDIVALDKSRRLALTKVPSTPKDLLEGIAAATKQVLALAGAKLGDIERFIHGTTVATNAVLEQKGATMGILTTEGFEDVLEMGHMKRSRMYDLAMEYREYRKEYRKIKQSFPPTVRAHPVAPRATGRLPNPTPGGWPCALPAARRPQDG